MELAAVDMPLPAINILQLPADILRQIFTTDLRVWNVMVRVAHSVGRLVDANKIKAEYSTVCMLALEAIHARIRVPSVGGLPHAPNGYETTLGTAYVSIVMNYGEYRVYDGRPSIDALDIHIPVSGVVRLIMYKDRDVVTRADGPAMYCVMVDERERLACEIYTDKRDITKVRVLFWNDSAGMSFTHTSSTAEVIKVCVGSSTSSPAISNCIDDIFKKAYMTYLDASRKTRASPTNHAYVTELANMFMTNISTQNIRSILYSIYRSVYTDAKVI